MQVVSLVSYYSCNIRRYIQENKLLSKFKNSFEEWEDYKEED